jgi:hypothetical protein
VTTTRCVSQAAVTHSDPQWHPTVLTPNYSLPQISLSLSLADCVISPQIIASGLATTSFACSGYCVPAPSVNKDALEQAKRIKVIIVMNEIVITRANIALAHITVRLHRITAYGL